MDRNRTLLGKKVIKDNVIENRTTFVENWKRDLNSIYTCPDLPRVPEFDHIEDIDLDALEAEAVDIPVTVESIGDAFKGKSFSTSPGKNAIGYEMLRYAFIADPD